MEAGIDVDFPVGYRALAGLDSIIQASGRVNRERKNPWGDMYVFEPDSAFVKRVPAYIAQGAAVARNILRKFDPDPISIQAINAYFNSLYSLQGGKRAFDARGILDCFENREGLNFKTAAERFKIIEDNTVSVIISWNEEAEQLIEELKYTPYPASTLRKLQMYTVNIYEPEYQALNSQGAIEIVADDYSALNQPKYYHPETGLIIPDSVGGGAIFF
jgi:CRISPR-associated endonuclease/helicase Cas3